MKDLFSMKSNMLFTVFSLCVVAKTPAQSLFLDSQNPLSEAHPLFSLNSSEKSLKGLSPEPVGKAFLWLKQNKNKIFPGDIQVVKAVQRYTEQAEKGDKKAQAQLGYMYLESNFHTILLDMGYSVDAIFLRGLKWVEKSVLSGNTAASPYLTRLNKFMELKNKAQKEEDKEQLFLVGQVYKKGGAGVRQNFKKAGKWIRRAALKNHPPAQYEMSRLDGGSSEESLKWLKKSAKNGYTKAQLSTGLHFMSQFMETEAPSHLNQALMWLKKAAHKNEASAQYMLAVLYTLNFQNKASYDKEATKWWKRLKSHTDTLDPFVILYSIEYLKPFYQKQLQKNRASNFPPCPVVFF